MQAAIFTGVEGSTVVITGNMRQAVETIFPVASGGSPLGTLRRLGIFFALCGVFGFGAAQLLSSPRTFPTSRSSFLCSRC